MSIVAKNFVGIYLELVQRIKSENGFSLAQQKVIKSMSDMYTVWNNFFAPTFQRLLDVVFF